MKMMNNYINIQTTNNNVPSFTDSTHGKETALKLIGQGCDVVFGVGGNTVNGVLLAAKENDHASAIMLQWFVTEQVEEEANPSEIIAQIKMIFHALAQGSKCLSI